MDAAKASNLIKERLLDSSPFALGRLGQTEAYCVTAWRLRRLAFNLAPIPRYLRENLKCTAGVFPNTTKGVSAFVEEYLEHLRALDFLTVWNVPSERWMIRNYCPQASLSGIHFVLNPFLLENPWTEALEGKRVLIIHAFPKTIAHQLGRRDKLFKNPKILPNFESILYRPVQSNGLGSVSEYQSWHSALEKMKEDISAINFDTALVSGGAYGLPLAGFISQSLKKKGPSFGRYDATSFWNSRGSVAEQRLAETVHQRTLA